jgi:Spy/CpxP family protein refolding chaperone
MRNTIAKQAGKIAVMAFILFALVSAGWAAAQTAAPGTDPGTRWAQAKEGHWQTRPVPVPTPRAPERWRRVHPGRSIIRTLYWQERRLIARRSDLGLDADQVDKIEGMLQAQRKYLIRTGANLRILRMDIRELLAKERIDLGAVEKKVKAIDDLAAARVMEAVRTFEKILAVLTPEQQKKVQAFFRESLLRW